MHKDLLLFTLGQASGHFLSIYKKWKRVYSQVRTGEMACLEDEFMKDIEALNEDWQLIFDLLEIDYVNDND